MRLARLYPFSKVASRALVEALRREVSDLRRETVELKAELSRLQASVARADVQMQRDAEAAHRTAAALLERIELLGSRARADAQPIRRRGASDSVDVI